MRSIKIYVFKESGKYYTEDHFVIPESEWEVYQIVDYVRLHFGLYPGMHLVMLLDEFEKGYPCMILAKDRVVTEVGKSQTVFEAK